MKIRKTFIYVYFISELIMFVSRFYSFKIYSVVISIIVFSGKLYGFL